MIRLGVIGHGGRVSSLIKEQFRQVEPDFRVVGIVDPDETGARDRLAECDRSDVVFYEDMQALVRGAKPDALVIGTRCNLHAPLAIEAFAYGLPIFLEKPIAIDMPQALALEDAYERTRCPVVVSFPLRTSPLCELAAERLAAGAVGRPDHVMATNYVPYGTVYFDRPYRNYGITQGLFIQKGTHDFDYLSYLMGAPIVRVAAMQTQGRIFGGDKPAGLDCSACAEAETCPESPANRMRNRSGGILTDHPCVFGEDIGTPQTGMNEDSSSALIEFASGAHGIYTQVFYTRRDAGQRGATISGYGGTLSFNWYANELRVVRHHQPFSERVEPDKGMSHFGGDFELGRDFVAMIRQGKPPRATLEDGLRSIYTCLAAKESAETGQFVAVRQVGGRG
jgi:predicted dehydrogenase